MSVDCITLAPFERVGVIREMLLNCQHECFPVTDPKRDNILVGTIMRKTLCMLLYHRAFVPSENDSGGENDADASGGGGKGGDKRKVSRTGGNAPPASFFTHPISKDNTVAYSKLTFTYPRFPDIEHCDMNTADQRCWLDLRPYINAAPYIVQENATLQRTYRLFRTMGLRHLCVTDLHNRVVGVITRKDLTVEALEDRMKESHQSFSTHISSSTWSTSEQTGLRGRRVAEGPDNPI